MNKKITADELSAQIESLLDEGNVPEAIEICGRLTEDSDPEIRIAALLLRACSNMAAGNVENARSDHYSAFTAAEDMLAIEQLGIAEDALKNQMPFDYCADLFIHVARRIKDECGDPVIAAGAYNKAGICLFRHGAPTSKEKECFNLALDAIAVCEDDPLLSDTAPDRRNVLGALIQSNLAECLSREGDVQAAKELYNQASAVFQRHLGDEDNICLTHYAICQRCLSDIYRGEEENIRAHACLSHSIAELERRRNKLPDQLRLHLAVCYNARGTLRFQMGDYEGEVEDCTQSLLLRENLEHDASALATVISNRAEAYTMLKQFEPAREDFIRAIELLDGIEDNPSAAASAATRSYSLGQLYSDNHCLPEACEAFRSAADRLASVRSSHTDDCEYTMEQLIDIEALARMRLGAALYQRDERDYFDAMTEGRQAIRLLERLPLTVERAARLAALHLSMGELLELFDELDAAEAEYELAEGYRDEGISLAISEAPMNDGEEGEYEQFENQSSIWENFSGDAPQG